MKYLFNELFNHLGGPASVILFATSLSSSAAVLAQEDFSGGAINLGGTTADVGGTWKATTNYKADGSVADTAGGAAILAFTPTVGQIYELSAQVTLGAAVHPATTAFAVGIGFANKNETAWSSNTPAPNNALRFQGASTPGLGWMWTINGLQNYIIGPQAANSATTASTTISGATLDLKVVLDTTGSNWTLAYFVNNIQQSSATLSGSNAPGGTSFATIDSVGFMNFGGRTGGTVDHFLLQTIPEPSAALLGGIGVLALLRRRRM